MLILGIRIVIFGKYVAMQRRNGRFLSLGDRIFGCLFGQMTHVHCSPNSAFDKFGAGHRRNNILCTLLVRRAGGSKVQAGIKDILGGEAKGREKDCLFVRHSHVDFVQAGETREGVAIERRIALNDAQNHVASEDALADLFGGGRSARKRPRVQVKVAVGILAAKATQILQQQLHRDVVWKGHVDCLVRVIARACRIKTIGKKPRSWSKASRAAGLQKVLRENSVEE